MQEKTFYDRISASYDALADSNERACAEAGLALLAPQPGERMLEIGYGTGHSLVALAKAVGSNGHVDGVDISDGMHRVASRRIDEAGLRAICTLKVAAIPPLPYGDNEFDGVTMSFTLELFPLDVIPQVLAECRRVLKPGGRIAVVSMALSRAGEKDSLLEKTYKWMHRHFPHIVDCQPIDSGGALTDAGFVIQHDEERKIWTMPVTVALATAPA